MRLRTLAVASILLGASLTASSSDEEYKRQLEESQKAIQFVAQFSVFKAYFDSVVKFCEPHVPKAIVSASQAAWNAENSGLTPFWDRELRRLVEVAIGIGAAPDAIENLEGVGERAYAREMKGNRMFKDLIGSSDLYHACSRRLGEMLSEGMRFQSMAPEAHAYYLSRRDSVR